MKSPIKVPRVNKGPGIQYNIINNKVSFSVSNATGNTSKTLGISIILLYPFQIAKWLKKNYTQKNHAI